MTRNQAPREDEPYQITHLPDDAPIYLEHLANIRMYHQKWKIVCFVDLKEIDDKKMIISNYINKLRILCTRRNKICKAIRLIDQLNRKIIRIKENKQLVDNILGRTSNNDGRTKRGLFNPLGELSKVLFGTLSDSDAEYYNTEIDRLHNDVKTVATLVKNQTQIIKTQILANLDNIKDFNSKFKIIDANNAELANRTQENEFNLQIDELIIELSNIVNEYGEDINNLMNAIADGRHGIVHPQLVPPDALFSALKEAGVSKDTFPVDLEVTSFTSLVDISESVLLYLNHKLVYVLHIPILEDQHYDAYRVIPIPRKAGPNTFSFYDPPDEYIVLNTLQTIFTLTNTDMLDKCKETKSYKVCKRNTPDYTVTHKDACLINLLKSHPNGQSCTIRYVKLQKTLWIQLKTNTQWIVTAGQPEMVHILCPDKQLRNIEIKNTLIFSLRPDCQAITEDIILKPEKTSRSNVSLNILLKDSTNNTQLNEQLRKAQLDLTDLPLTQLDDAHHLDSHKLRGLGNTLDEIDRQIESISKHRRTRTMYEVTMDGLKYAGYAAISIIGVYLIYKFKLLKLLKQCIQPVAKPCTQTFINCFHKNPRESSYSVRYTNNQDGHISTSPSVSSLFEPPPLAGPSRPSRQLDFAINPNKLAKS